MAIIIIMTHALDFEVIVSVKRCSGFVPRVVGFTIQQSDKLVRLCYRYIHNI